MVKNTDLLYWTNSQNEATWVKAQQLRKSYWIYDMYESYPTNQNNTKSADLNY
jgi:hypothetical protein